VRGVFVDANPSLAEIFERLRKGGDPEVTINNDPDIKSDQMPKLLVGAEIVVIDHTALPTDIAKQCKGLKHVVFLGTGARSYMNPDELAELGIEVHLIKGYGDTAVAESAIALMWASARVLAQMDREMRVGNWLREDAMQLTGKTLGLIGFGGIAAEVARIALGSGMKVIAWNRTPRPGEALVALDELLARADVISLHLVLSDQTMGLLGPAQIARIKPGAVLINTARGALVDEAALIEALRCGRVRHAGLDVYHSEPLAPDHPFAAMDNVTLTAHAGFRTLEASMTLLRRAIDIVNDIVAGVGSS